MCVSVCACVLVCMRVSMCACVYVCMCEYVCICVHVYVCVHVCMHALCMYCVYLRVCSACQGMTLCGLFPPSTFLGVLEIELRSSSFVALVLTSRAIFPVFIFHVFPVFLIG